MKRFVKVLTVTCVAALALAAVSAAGASAAQFTASETGTLEGTQESNQVFTPKPGGTPVTCTTAHTTGTIVSKEAATQEVTVEYGNCTAFGFTAKVSPAKYRFEASGTVDILNEIKIEVPLAGCTNTVKSAENQNLEMVAYTNIAGGEVTENSTVSKITSSGPGACAGSTEGTYTGNSKLKRVGGGTLSVDTP